ncbi:NmrA family NAD(P)-binding protein [Shewanella dokdonensis]|uniref:NmrA family NAD(P)-binding protein n=1 Tax=Shewanella dokdonensis TaxID=712036 RepID=A0ABX8DGX3_9GAMM|nr:NmrA family NAD(P)-binding protein [Shewanella dokdonensis]QVK23987.1 NmrA family NAD(P)-binding protein [Shewanella dokdonensis]
MTEKIVVVAGASGVLGEDIANALLNKPNVQVRILTRPQSVEKLAALKDKGAEIVAIDLEQSSSEQLASALSGAFSWSQP